MPATQEVEIEQEQEPETPAAQRSASFNSMADKLNKAMAPFVEAAKESPAAPEPVKPVDAKPPVTQITIPPKLTQEKLDATAKDLGTKEFPAVALEEKKPEEELPESIRKSPKASEEFRKIQTTAKQFKAESEKHAASVKTLEEQLAKLKTAPATPVMPPEFETLKKEHEELSNQLKIASIERHPNFRTHFENRTTAAIEKAKSILGPEMTDKASKLAHLPPSDYRAEQLDKMILETHEASPSKALFLTDLIKDINAIAFDKEAALKKAQVDYDIVQKHEQEQAQVAQAEQAKKKESFVAQALEASKDLEAFRRGEDPKINQAVDEREKFIKSMFNGEIDEKLLPYIPVLAMEATYLREQVLPSLRDENAKLLKQIQEMTQSAPRPGEGSGQGQAPAPQAGRGFIEKYKQLAPTR